MSFAFNAAPFNQNSNNDTNIIQQKRDSRNKTIKRRESSSQMESLIQKLHNTNNDNDNDNDEIENFTPMSPPHSESITKTIEKEKEKENENNKIINRPVQNNQANQNNGLLPNTEKLYEAFSQKGLNNNASDYYQQYIPTYYNKMSENTAGSKELLEKLNYMIHLLEEQQDEKTGHVTEEIILYSFLGVFMIFIIDSFARAGKYVR
jgi:hypothetical protein